MPSEFFAVVSACHDEDDSVVERCVQSVRDQEVAWPVRHYVVCDGFHRKLPSDVHALALPHTSSDCGDTPRCIGAALAIRDGCSGLMFLDIDNTLHPHHLAHALRLHRSTRAAIVLAQRRFLRPDGTELPLLSVEDRDHLHVDTNCFVLFGAAIGEVLRWATVPRSLACIGDRVFWEMLRETPHTKAATHLPTVRYACRWAASYEAVGETPPPGSKRLEPALAALGEWWNQLSEADREATAARLPARIVLWLRSFSANAASLPGSAIP